MNGPLLLFCNLFFSATVVFNAMCEYIEKNPVLIPDGHTGMK